MPTQPLPPSSTTTTSSSSSTPTSTRELTLISNVTLALAHASSAPSLQALLGKYLPGLLLKLGSPHAAVRQAAREACAHVVGRLRAENEVLLPLRDLVRQFRGLGSLQEKGEGGGWMGIREGGLREEVRRFAVVFMGIGLGRVSVDGEIKGGRSLLGEFLAWSGAEAPTSTEEGGGGGGGGVDGREGRLQGGEGKEEEEEKEATPIQVQVRADNMSLDTRLWIQGFYFLLKLLPTWDFPERGSQQDHDLKSSLGLSPQETKHLARWLSKFLLCDSRAFAAPESLAKAHDSGGRDDHANDGEDQDVGDSELMKPLPGLTAAERSIFAAWGAGRRQASKNKAAFETLVIQTKAAAAKFLFTAVFTDEERFIPAVIMGADDTHLTLFRVADTMFKQCNFDLEREDFVRELYDLYFGRHAPPKEETSDYLDYDEILAAEQRYQERLETQVTLGARPKLQIRILALLAKSKMATTNPKALLRIVDQQLTQTTEFGLEATKLRTALFNLLNWVSRIASEADVLAVASNALEGFVSYIMDQGWPNPSDVGKPMSRPELDMRGKTYENIGTWAARAKFAESPLDKPEDSEKMKLLEFLFTSLRCDASSIDIHISIESALGRLLNRFASTMNDQLTNRLREMLMQHIDIEVGQTDATDGYKTVRSTRFAAVRFANRCLPFADCEARWMDLIAIGAGGVSGRQEIVEEGKKGLDPYWWSTLNGGQSTANNIQFPRYNELVRYFFGDTNGQKLTQESRKENRYALPAAVGFCRIVLLQEALASTDVSFSIEPEWEEKSEALLATNANARSTTRSHLKEIKRHRLTVLIDAALTGMAQQLGRCADYAVELCSLMPDFVIGKMLDRVATIKPVCLSNNLAIQLRAARILGIFASHSECPEADREDSIEGALTEIRGWRDAVGQEVNRVRGFVLCLTFILSRQALRGTLAADSGSLVELTKLLLDLLSESRDGALRSASHIALGQLMLCLDQATRERLDLRSEMVIEQLTRDAKKEQESAVSALGRFVWGLSDEQEASRMAEKALESLYELHEIKRPELQFAVGEALSVAAAGWHSKATIADFDLDVPRPTQAVGEAMLQTMLDKIIKDCKNTKPSLKKASAIWLLCLVQYVGDEMCVQSRLRQCQAAFGTLLSDRDEIVQETGSRGLSLVYEMGDKNLKDDLVRDLITSFTGSNAKLGGTVTADTELFDPGALPTGDGSVTTYKDIVSLAAEMGDPSLVYRFMNLASNNAIWTSRSAFGRFGLGNVLADSAYLAENKSFYPKLYRYRFDPNPNVQKSMNDIWNALVKDSNAVIDQHFEPILEDLLKSLITGKEWRVRQASCAAIAEVIQGRDVDKYEKYLNEIWTKAFKVLDDIKETVRTAAMTLCRTLTNLLIRNLEVGAGTTSRAQKMLNHAMPFLLQQLGSGAAKEVQEYAIKTLLKIIKKSPPQALQPFAPVILETLVNSLSSLEPEGINYVHLNAEKYGFTAEKLDSLRVTQVSSSPAIQAIERCLESLDEMSMPEAMKRLEACFKSAVDLPSKIGLSSVLVSLTVRHSQKFGSYADRFATQLRKYLLDRNETVTNSYCQALAYLMRIASDAEIEATCRYTKSLYFASEEIAHRHVAGDIVHAISKVSNDRFMAFATLFLPFAFVGRNDIDKEVREPFQKTWEENVGGSRAVSLYLAEITDLAQYIDSPKWGIKHTIACAIADLVSCLDSAMDGKYTLNQAEAIWPLLEKALAGKTWDGKEAVVAAFPKFVSKAEVIWEDKGDQFDRIALREAKRTNAAYQPHSIKALGEIVTIREGPDMAQKALIAMNDVVEELLKNSEDRMEVDAGEASLNSEARQEASVDKILSAVIVCCFKIVTFSNGGGGVGGATNNNLQMLMTILEQSLHKGSTLSSLVFYEGIKTFFNKVMEQSRRQLDVRVGMLADFEAVSTGVSTGVSTMAEGIASILLPNGDGRFVPTPEQGSTEPVRLARARAILAYSSCGVQDQQQREQISRAVNLWLIDERSGQVRDILREAHESLGIPGTNGH